MDQSLAAAGQIIGGVEPRESADRVLEKYRRGGGPRWSFTPFGLALAGAARAAHRGCVRGVAPSPDRTLLYSPVITGIVSRRRRLASLLAQGALRRQSRPVVAIRYPGDPEVRSLEASPARMPAALLLTERRAE